MLVGIFRHERRDVVDRGGLISDCPGVVTNAAAVPGLRRVRRDCVDQFLLELDKIGGRFDDNAGNAKSYQGCSNT